MIVRTIHFNGVTYLDSTVEYLLSQGISQQSINEAINSQLWALVRNERDNKISQTDWTQMPDSPLPVDKKTEFAAYRQALRDIPQTFKKPDEVDWPPVPVL